MLLYIFILYKSLNIKIFFPSWVKSNMKIILSSGRFTIIVCYAITLTTIAYLLVNRNFHICIICINIYVYIPINK